MSNSNSSIEKHPTKSGSKYECLDCENYKRKVKEAEQTVSGRDVLIEMLQGEIKKMEERYKVSIDDYESLRFKYCTVVQELSNLKEIHKKLEKSHVKLAKERDLAKGQLEMLQNEIMDSCKKQCKELTIELIPTEEGEGMKPLPSSFHDTILKEMMNIEVIIQNQNETVKDVLQKVLNEMKGVKSSKQIEEVLQKSTSYSKYNDNTKDQNKEDLLTTIEDLSNQLNAQTTLVEELKAENDAIKTQLADKKSNLAQCLDVLEDNHSNLNNLSGNIEMIISEKETYLKEIGELKDTIKDYETIMDEKDKEISELKNKFQQQSDVNLRRDNDELRKELNECQRELEQLQEDYLEKTKQCNIERCTQLAKALIEAKSTGDKRMKEVISNLEKEIIETSKQGEESLSEYKENDEVAELTEKIKLLEQNLEQAKLENSEFEEENKYYTQKIDGLVAHIQILEKEKQELQNNNEEKLRIDELKREYENLNSQKDHEIKELKDEINYLKQSIETRESKDEIVQTEIKETDPEKAEISKENEYLKNQIVTLENEIMNVQEDDERHILMLQDKIDRLENSQNKKQKEIDECCCVVRNIKETIADKNFIDENNLAHIALLEEQNCKLQQQINALRAELAAYEVKYKGCDCTSHKQYTDVQDLEATVNQLQTDNKQMEVELCQRVCIAEKLQTDKKEMEIEICRRQCTINHLEQCLDKSNKILAECEKEMKAMHFENENLTKENDSLRNDLKEYAFETERSSVEKSALQEKVTAITRQSQQLELEKYHLSKNLQGKSNLEDQLNQLKKDYKDLAKTMQQRDEELEDARHQIEFLQHSLEASKKEYGKVLTAYKEVKDTLSEEIKKYNEEREKMSRETEKMKQDVKTEEKCTACSNIKELNSIIMDKERKIKSLQCQNRELDSEVNQLKTYVNKLISDNKHLRTAIDNLLATLVEKLKNFTENEDISLKSNEMIVKDILNSLIDLEQDVMVTNSTVGEKCNCMSVIMSTYKISAKDVRSQGMPACKQKCGKRIKDVSKYAHTKISSSHGMVNVCADCCAKRPDQPSERHSPGSSYDFLVEPGPSS